jgi:hypothetical protein
MQMHSTTASLSFLAQDIDFQAHPIELLSFLVRPSRLPYLSSTDYTLLPTYALTKTPLSIQTAVQ